METTPKMTPKQYLKLHPEKYVMVTYEFGEPIYIAPCSGGKIQATGDKTAAEQWSALDIAPLNYLTMQRLRVTKG